MQKIIKSFLTVITNVSDKLVKNNSKGDVMSYFNAEYKKDAKCAYDYWITTKNVNYNH